MAPKVLVCCPTSDKKSYCDSDWFEMVQLLDYPDYEVFLADNSADLEYYKKIQRMGFKTTHIRSQDKPFVKVLAESHEACRLYAINYGFDYMLHLESDVFPTTSKIIQRLIKHNVPVVSAPYFIDHGAKSRLAIQVEEPMQLHGQYHFINHPLQPGSDILFIDGTLKPCTAVGLGCTLIHKSAFENTPFRCVLNVNAYPDTFFFWDIFQKGIQAYVDTALICNHRNQASTDFMARV